jgi:aminomethyltransferase
MSPRRSPLDAAHRAAGARMIPFGGWEMPIQYHGVLEEHRACREHGVVFDVSHLGAVWVRGAGARATLQHALTNDLSRIDVGRAQYSHLLDADDAHVVDDVIVWWVSEQDLLVMPNASNTDDLVAALEEETTAYGAGDATVEDVTATRAVLAIQGPDARRLLTTVDAALAAPARFRVAAVPWHGYDCLVAGTGYTGEDGVEIHVPADGAAELWDAVVEAGLVPAGLGARDTLRLEMGYPLHGHELGPGITPLQAGLEWVVRFDKGDFRGRAALERERSAGVRRQLRGLVGEGRQVPRAGYAVSVDGTPVGEITSGNFSPTLGRGIALAFLPPSVEPDTTATIDIRGRPVAAEVVDPPFVKPGAR